MVEWLIKTTKQSDNEGSQGEKMEKELERIRRSGQVKK
jgi:hypothetical protein